MKVLNDDIILYDIRDLISQVEQTSVMQSAVLRTHLGQALRAVADQEVLVDDEGLVVVDLAEAGDDEEVEEAGSLFYWPIGFWIVSASLPTSSITFTPVSISPEK